MSVPELLAVRPGHAPIRQLLVAGNLSIRIWPFSLVSSFLVYLWLAAEQARRQKTVQVSYQELAESVGPSKSSVQDAVRWLIGRKLLVASKAHPTDIPSYTVRSLWKDASRAAIARRSQ